MSGAGRVRRVVRGACASVSCVAQDAYDRGDVKHVGLVYLKIAVALIDRVAHDRLAAVKNALEHHAVGSVEDMWLAPFDISGA